MIYMHGHLHVCSGWVGGGIGSPLLVHNSHLLQEIGQAQFEKVFQNRVCAVSGDVLSENMGIAPKMLTELRANVQVRTSLSINVKGTWWWL